MRGSGPASRSALVSDSPAQSKVRELIETQYASKCSASVKPVIEYGAQSERIVEFAKSEGVDLIVMGARGIGFLEGLQAAAASPRRS